MRLLAYGPEAQVARVDVSEQEAAIRAARQAWLKARNEAEAKRLAYVAEKGDFSDLAIVLDAQPLGLIQLAFAGIVQMVRTADSNRPAPVRCPLPVHRSP